MAFTRADKLLWFVVCGVLLVAWCLVLVAWCLVLGAWCLLFGVCCLLFGVCELWLVACALLWLVATVWLCLCGGGHLLLLCGMVCRPSPSRAETETHAPWSAPRSPPPVARNQPRVWSVATQLSLLKSGAHALANSPLLAGSLSALHSTLQAPSLPMALSDDLQRSPQLRDSLKALSLMLTTPHALPAVLQCSWQGGMFRSHRSQGTSFASDLEMVCACVSCGCASFPGVVLCARCCALVLPLFRFASHPRKCVSCRCLQPVPNSPVVVVWFLSMAVCVAHNSTNSRGAIAPTHSLPVAVPSVASRCACNKTCRPG